MDQNTAVVVQCYLSSEKSYRFIAMSIIIIISITINFITAIEIANDIGTTTTTTNTILLPTVNTNNATNTGIATNTINTVDTADNNYSNNNTTKPVIPSFFSFS